MMKFEVLLGITLYKLLDDLLPNQEISMVWGIIFCSYSIYYLYIQEIRHPISDILFILGSLLMGSIFPTPTFMITMYHISHTCYYWFWRYRVFIDFFEKYVYFLSTIILGAFGFITLFIYLFLQF